MKQLIRKVTPFLLVLPALIVVCIVMVYPLIYNFSLSFFQWNYVKHWEGMTFVGLGNYFEALLSPEILYSLRITLVYAAATLFIQFILGLGLALLFDVETLPGKYFFRASLLIPMMSSAVVIGFVWKAMLNPDFGIINYYFSQLGFGNRSFLGNPSLALYTVIAVGVWAGTPFCYLMLTAGLRGLPQEALEASKLDGANTWQQLIYVKLPLLRPIIVVILIFQFIFVFGVFGMIYVLTAGGPASLTKVFSLLLYEIAFDRFELGLGATLSVIYALIAFIFAILFVVSVREEKS